MRLEEMAMPLLRLSLWPSLRLRSTSFGAGKPGTDFLAQTASARSGRGRRIAGRDCVSRAADGWPAEHWHWCGSANHLSGVAFGLVHGIWALFRGSWRAGLGAITATGILGAALGIVYIVGGRSLAPCVTAHFWINVFSEPGLMLAAIRGEMGRGLTRLRPENVG